MTHWNYRATKDTYPNGEDVYGIREVHYDDAGNVRGWSENFTTPTGDSRRDLVQELEHMVRDASHGVLDLETRELIPAKGASDDPDRIEGVLDALRAACLRQPDFRLGQVIANAVVGSRPGAAMPDLYNIEDDELIDALDRAPL